jgi:hypothetical protein
MLKRRGASDLGIKVDWQYEFFGHGRVLSPRLDTVALDIGNRLEPGVLDQHQDGSLAPSTAMLIWERPELAYDHLMEPWLRRADDGVSLEGKRWSPVITTHRSPDFDGVVSALLVQEIVQHGMLPDWAESLAGFASEVDQGRWSFSADQPERMNCVALAFYAIDEEVLGRRVADEQRMKLGMELVRSEVKHLASKKNRLEREDWYGEHAGGWAAANEDARKIADATKADSLAFKKEKEEGLFEERAVAVPVLGTSTRETMKVKAAIALEKSESRLLKYWVRGSGCPMLVCPMSPDKSRVIVSLDPNYCDDEGRRPSLEELGYALELLECQERKKNNTETRSGTPRYDNVTNDDPWYDGRGHGFGIVDSPRSGTQIPYPEIVGMATGGRFWQRRISLSIRVHRICSGKTQPEGQPALSRKKPDALGVGCGPIFEDLSVSDNPTTEQRQKNSDFWGPLPALGELTRNQVQYLTWPKVTSELYIEETNWSYAQGSDLDLVKWLQALRRSNSSVFFVIRHEDDEGHAWDTESPERTAARLLDLSLEEGSRHQVASRLFCSGRETFTSLRENDLPWEDLADTQLVIAVYHGLLSHLLRQDTAKSRSSMARKAKKAKRLAEQINAVLARYAVQEVSGVTGLQEMSRIMGSQLGLGPMTERARHEADALDSVVEKHQGRNIEFFLFLLGLMGLTQTVTAIEDLTTLDWVYWSGASFAAAVGALWGLHLFRVCPFKRD